MFVFLWRVDYSIQLLHIVIGLGDVLGTWGLGGDIPSPSLFLKVLGCSLKRGTYRGLNFLFGAFGDSLASLGHANVPWPFEVL